MSKNLEVTNCDFQIRQNMKKNSEIFRMAEKIVRLQKKAKKLGLFLDDRELLKCKKCGLMEDVNSYGVLLTVFKNEPLRDTALRFKKIKGRSNHFQCPNCDEILMLSGKGTGYE